MHDVFTDLCGVERVGAEPAEEFEQVGLGNLHPLERPALVHLVFGNQVHQQLVHTHLVRAPDNGLTLRHRPQALVQQRPCRPLQLASAALTDWPTRSVVLNPPNAPALIERTPAPTCPLSLARPRPFASCVTHRLALLPPLCCWIIPSPPRRIRKAAGVPVRSLIRLSPANCRSVRKTPIRLIGSSAL